MHSVVALRTKMKVSLWWGFMSVVPPLTARQAMAINRGIASFVPSVTSRCVLIGMFRRSNLVERNFSWFLLNQPGNQKDFDEPENNRIQQPFPYAAYEPKRNATRSSSPGQRRFSTWTVPETISVPEDRLEISFARSSGAGGQNVNKVNTKVELRFLVDEADWIPSEVRDRLKQQQANRINKEGYLALQAQEYRTQAQNRKAAILKLTEILKEAWPRPKIRKQREGPSKATKERNKEDKQKRSETKARRQRVDF